MTTANTLHDILDNEHAAGRHCSDRVALRWMADAMEQDGPIGPAIEYASMRRDAARNPKDREFWHRLIGSLRKAATL